MEISNNYHSPAFGMKIYDNKNFNDLLEWGQKHRVLPALDDIFNNLSHVEGEDLLIIHGKTPQGLIYSAFTSGRRTVRNSTVGAESPEQATFKALKDLMNPENPKLMQLIRGNVKRNLTIQSIIEKYAVK